MKRSAKPAPIVLPPKLPTFRSFSVPRGISLQLHVNWQNADSPFVESSKWVDAIAPLALAGIKTARTPLGPCTPKAPATLLLQRLHRELGMTFDVTVSPSLVSEARDLINKAHALFPEIVNTFQGLNEPNAGDPAGWEELVILHTIGIYEAIRAYDDWSMVSIGSFSNWGRQTRFIDRILAAGWLTRAAAFIDWINLHYYTGARPPLWAGAPDGTKNEEGDSVNEVPFSFTLADLQRLKPGAKFRITENGWNVRDNPSTWYTSANVAAKYGQRMWFEALNNGVRNTVWFEAFDNPYEPDKVYGMLKYASPAGPFTRRPAFNTAMNTAALFNDTSPDAETFTVSRLPASIAAKDTVHYRCHQKADGSHLLALWNEVPSHSRVVPYGDIAVPGEPTIIDFGVAKAVRVARPHVSGSYSDLTKGASKISVNVPDDVLVLEIKAA